MLTLTNAKAHLNVTFDTDSTATFRTYFYPGITLEHRAVFEGKAFKITSIRELGRHAGLDLTCERVGL